VTREWLEGDGLFETILVRDGRPLFLDAHLDRLNASAGRLGLPAVRKGVAATCRDRAADFDGRGKMRVLLDRDGAAVTLDPFDGYPEEIYTEGVVVAMAPIAGHPLGDRAGHKALPYSPLLDARREARERGAFDVIFTDHDGALLEGSACNLFVVADGVLRTPPLTRAILPGITRARTLDAAAAAGRETREEDLRPSDLLAAEEAFLTGSLMEIVPIRAVGDAPLPRGPVTSGLRRTVFKCR
jgi:branched-subunit amino acid aminotransferase/4-amino-4-deoxychorismate lyase